MNNETSDLRYSNTDEKSCSMHIRQNC